MTVRKFRNAWWVDFRVDYTRYRRRSPDNCKAGAQAYEATLRRKLAEGIALKPPTQIAETRPTFETFAAIWFRDYVMANNKFSEQRAKRSILDHDLSP